MFLPFFSPGFTHRLLRGRRFAVPEVERFPLDMWVATDTTFECSSVRFRANHAFKTTLFKMNPSNENECSKLSWGGGGGEILISVHARELGVEKFSRHMYFKQYFTRYEFIKGNFKGKLQTSPYLTFL